MKHKKILKCLLTSILIIIIIYTNTPFAYALTLEVGPSKPSEGEGSGGGPGEGSLEFTEPPIEPPETEPGVIYSEEVINYYTGISGNIYEDLGNLNIGKEGEDDSAYFGPAMGVKVNLYKEDGSENGLYVGCTFSDKNGNYVFENLSDGTYHTEFVYGDISGMTASNIDLVRSGLKYNGHDYMTTSTPSGGDYLSTEKLEVMQSGKGAAQVYITIDCSTSMRLTEVKVNGETKTRLQIAVESAKKLIDSLMDSGENIYVGLVYFSGEAFRCVSITKNKQLLYEGLDSILTNWYIPNTNIVSALDKARDSFYNNDPRSSNRYIALISDGIPTKDNTTEVYGGESYEESAEKIYNIIAPSTKNKVAQLVDDGIKIFSLFTKSEDPEDNALVEDIFKEKSTYFANVEDGNEIIYSITQDIKELLCQTTSSKEYSDGFSVYAGYEDSTRRAEVFNNFKTFNYDNTILFDMIDNYDGSSSAIAQAKKLSGLTWMRVEGGKGYEIKNKPADLPDCEYSIDGSTYVEGEPPEELREEAEKKAKEEDRDIIIHIIRRAEINIDGQDLTLRRIPAFLLTTTVTATELKVTLNNGSVLNTQNREPGSDLSIFQTIDTKLAQGAKVEIEYTVSVKNNSSLQCNALQLIAYFPQDFYYKRIEIPNTTTVGRVKLGELKDKNLISEETLSTFDNTYAIGITLRNDGFYIPSGGEYSFTIVVERIISTMYEMHNDYQINAEVLAYENEGNRRMIDTTTSGKIATFKSIFPGDSKDRDFADTNTNAVMIVPPTGGIKINVTIIKITIILLFVTSILAIGILKVRKNKNNIHTHHK